jgi:hypothetical protein
MDFEKLSETDKAVIGQALRAAADGPFFPDWEFHTLFGLERSDVRATADAWPVASPSAEKLAIAVNNALNNLLGYSHSKDAVWSQWITVDRKQLNELFKRLRGGPDGRFFDRLK